MEKEECVMKATLLTLIILISLGIGGLGANIMFGSPGWPPELIETHGYYYYGLDQGFYRTLGGQELEIIDLIPLTINHPEYGTIYQGTLINGLGIEMGYIYWNSGGDRDYAMVFLNGGEQHELEVMGAPFGEPAPFGESNRGAIFVSPWG